MILVSGKIGYAIMNFYIPVYEALDNRTLLSQIRRNTLRGFCFQVFVLILLSIALTSAAGYTITIQTDG